MGNLTIQNYVKQTDDVIKKYRQVKSKAINSILARTQFDSKIVFSSNDQNLLQNWLRNPLKIDLIYRASENRFDAAKFHQKCDKIPHTLVLIKTEHGKIVGGYTPCKWNSASNDLSKDITNSNFIFSLNLQQKMDLSTSQSAIYCNSQYGPVFGYFDILISDKCDLEKSSYTKFPSSYNYEPEYGKCQQSRKAFCGVQSGSNFSVLEYEVFKLSWK